MAGDNAVIISLGPEPRSNYSHRAASLTMFEYLTLIEDGVRKYSHLSHARQFWAIKADLKRALMGRLEAPSVGGGTSR